MWILIMILEVKFCIKIWLLWLLENENMKIALENREWKCGLNDNFEN